MTPGSPPIKSLLRAWRDLRSIRGNVWELGEIEIKKKNTPRFKLSHYPPGGALDRLFGAVIASELQMCSMMRWG